MTPVVTKEPGQVAYEKHKQLLDAGDEKRSVLGEWHALTHPVQRH